MAVLPITSYSEHCRPYVPEQYKASEKLLGLVDAFLTQCDSLEAAFQEMVPMLDPEQAVGPSLDFIGDLVGVARNPGETDASYRPRVLQGFHSSGIPAPEPIRDLIVLQVGRPVMLVPCWPAAMYFVVDGSAGEIDIPALEAGYMPSGVALGQGTYMCGEPTDDGNVDFGFIVSEDNGMPIVCDYMRYALEFDLVDDEDNNFVTSSGDTLIALEYILI